MNKPRLFTFRHQPATPDDAILARELDTVADLAYEYWQAGRTPSGVGDEEELTDHQLAEVSAACVAILAFRKARST
jgi:hypothetical protein